MKPVVYFVNDFGSEGPYVGQVEGVIKSASDAAFINLLSNAPKTNPYYSAYLLEGLIRGLPKQPAYLLAVVDPGVGGVRKVIKVKLRNMILLAPDNGLLAIIIKHNPDAIIEELLDKPEDISNSFHARDWFAPVICQLINQETVHTRLLSQEEIQGRDWPGEINKVIYTDHYGNLVTGIRHLASDAKLGLGAKENIMQANTFSDVREGQLFWYINSMKLIEVAANGASAADLLNVSIGAEVKIN